MELSLHALLSLSRVEEERGVLVSTGLELPRRKDEIKPPGLEFPLEGVELFRELVFEGGDALGDNDRRSREYFLTSGLVEPGRFGCGLRTLKSWPTLTFVGKARG